MQNCIITHLRYQYEFIKPKSWELKKLKKLKKLKNFKFISLYLISKLNLYGYYKNRQKRKEENQLVRFGY